MSQRTSVRKIGIAFELGRCQRGAVVAGYHRSANVGSSLSHLANKFQQGNTEGILDCRQAAVGQRPNSATGELPQLQTMSIESARHQLRFAHVGVSPRRTRHLLHMQIHFHATPGLEHRFEFARDPKPPKSHRLTFSATRVCSQQVWR